MMVPCDGCTATVTVLAGLLSLISLTQASSAVLSPLSLIASLNAETVHVFECTVTRAERADVLINNTPFDNQEIQDRGVMVSSITVDSETGTIDSNITIPATIENNGTSIECLSVNFSGPSVVRSSIATYLLQGLLEAPSTEFAAVNESYLSFVWTAPFTLDITYEEPDIQFYTLRESLTSSSANMTETGGYVFPNLAVAVDFSVSAWNVVGEGETASATHQPCTISAEQQTVNSAEVGSEVMYQDDTMASLTLSLDWPTVCVPLFLVQLVSEEEEGDGMSNSRQVPRVTGSGGDRQLHLTLPLRNLPDNTHYTAQLTTVTDQREVVVAGTVPYSTHDVQAVRINFTPSSITTSCRFAVGSVALGCSVHILDQAGAQVEVRMVMRDSGTNGEGLLGSVEVTVEGLVADVYTVSVYDIESNGQASTDGAPAHTETVNITVPTAPPPITSGTTSGTSTTTPDIAITNPLSPESQPSNTVPIIAGAIVGGVLLIAGAVLALFSAVVCVMRSRQRKSEASDQRDQGEFVLIMAGTTISADSVSAPHLGPAHTLQASTSPSPAYTLQGSKTSVSERDSVPPPTYSDVIGHKHAHSLSDMSNSDPSHCADTAVHSSNMSGGGRGGVATQESQVHLLADTDSSHGTMQKPTDSLKKATLSAPSSSPTPPPPKTQTPLAASTVSPRHTSHTHLQRHQRSSSLDGQTPPHSPITTPRRNPSFTPMHPPQSRYSPSHQHTSHPLHSHISTHPPSPPPKKSPAKKSRAPPAPSLSTPALLPPPPIQPSTLTYQDIRSGQDDLGKNNQANNNPLYDTAEALLQLKAEEKKRRSIHYTEIHTNPQPAPTPSQLVPRDREVVMYSELNIGELAPRLPSKRIQATPSQPLALEALPRAH